MSKNNDSRTLVHPWPVHSYCQVFNNNHSRDGDVGRIIHSQKSFRIMNAPWEYELEFSDLRRFWFASDSVELIKRAKIDGIPGEDLA